MGVEYYTFLSNGLTSALELNASIDWFPCPRFDSPSVFTKILDEDNGGYYQIKPIHECKIKVSYLGNSTASQTIFSSDKGVLKLIDFLPLGLPAIIRLFESEIPFVVDIKPVFNYGLINPAIEVVDKGLIFKNPTSKEGLELSINGKYTLENSSKIIVEPGKGYLFLLYTRDLRYGLFSQRAIVYPDPYESLKYFLLFWEDNVKDVKPVNEEFRDAYMRSLITILALMYRPSGGIIASPTTSLPEIIGSDRNWDYRYVWVRDATYAIEALIKANLITQAKHALDFLFSVVDPSSKPFDHPLYPVDGTEPIAEEEIEWLDGYKNSKPVRIGNSAYLQLQMDTEGSFMNCIYEYFLATNDAEYIIQNWWVIEAIVDWVKKSWRNKSTSLWEERGIEEHFVHTKLMNWVAMDRTSKLAFKLGYKELSQECKGVAEEIRQDILINGYSNEMNSFTSYYGSKNVDASLLTLPLYDFIDAKDQRFLSTLKRIENELQVFFGLLLRYKRDFLGKAQYPFLLCSSWLARVYIRLGEFNKARKIIKKMIDCSTNLILFGEHLDSETLEHRGNFPHIFPHAGLVISIIELEKSLQEKKSR
jgi:GH15 family glucan-1,4-alpha-glucosidase